MLTVSVDLRRAAARTSMPSKSSSRRSVSTRSKTSCSIWTSASSPRSAVAAAYPAISRIAAIVMVTLSWSSTIRTLGGIGRWTSGRERHAEDRTAARSVADLEPAAVALRDAEAHPEPEAGALLPLRREERLEDVREVLLGDARAGVRDLQAHRIGADEAGRRVAMRFGRHRDEAALGHGLRRIEDEVETDLLDLVGRRHHLAELRVEQLLDLHVPLPQALRHHALGRLDERVEVRRDEARGRSVEPEHLPEDPAHPPGLLHP